LTDQQIIELASWAAQARATHHASQSVSSHPNTDSKVVQLRRDGDAA
jgi:hypothetical protein